MPGIRRGEKLGILRTARRRRAEHMLHLEGVVYRQWAALRLFEAALPAVTVAWGDSRQHLLRLHAWTARLEISRPLGLARSREGVFTLPTARLEDAVRHHAAHLLAGAPPSAAHDADWRRAANRLGVLRVQACDAVEA
jgi:hypothetical protein